MKLMPDDSEFWNNRKVLYRRRPKRRGALLTKGRIFILLILIFLGGSYIGFYQLLHLERVQIKEIYVSGEESVDEATIQTELFRSIEGDRWHTLPRSNIFFFSPKKAGAALKKRFPALKDVEIEKVLPNTLAVTVSERKLWAVFCKAPQPGEVPENCFFIDRQGIAYDEAPHVEGSLILLVYAEEFSPTLGEIAFFQDEIAAFEEWDRVLREKAEIRIRSFLLKQNSPKDIWLKTAEGFEIIIAKAESPERTAEVLRTVLENEIGEKRSSLEYIDARFGNKVFLKYKS